MSSQIGIVRKIVDEGAIVELATGIRNKPMMVPAGMEISVGQKVKVAKVSARDSDRIRDLQRRLDVDPGSVTAMDRIMTNDTSGTYIIEQGY